MQCLAAKKEWFLFLQPLQALGGTAVIRQFHTRQQFPIAVLFYQKPVKNISGNLNIDISLYMLYFEHHCLIFDHGKTYE